MIATIIIVSLALYWLARETDYLRIRLLVGILAYDDSDYETEYDGSDSVFLDDYELQAKESIEDIAYEAWLKKRYEPKYVYGGFPDKSIDPRDKWMAAEENLHKRRNGEMPYQRG